MSRYSITDYAYECDGCGATCKCWWDEGWIEYTRDGQDKPLHNCKECQAKAEDEHL